MVGTSKKRFMTTTVLPCASTEAKLEKMLEVVLRNDENDK
jgi:hypothetical protein